LSASVLSACAVEDWRSADLQLDVTGAELSDTQRMRVCVAEAGTHVAALQSGRLAFAGLPVDGALTVTVEAVTDDLTPTGRVGPISLDDATPWVEASWSDCDDCEPCTATGSLVAEGDPSRLLGVRFHLVQTGANP